MSYWGRCLTGAVVYLVSCRTGTVVVPGQLSYLDSCLPGQLLAGQLSWGTVVAWGDVGASKKLLMNFVQLENQIITMTFGSTVPNLLISRPPCFIANTCRNI